MNNVSIVGYLRKKPYLSRTKQGFKVSKFQIVLENDKDDRYSKKITNVNCLAVGEIANYLFRNCCRGTLLEITGMLMSDKFDNNFVYCEYLTALTKREIVIERFDKFIERYSSALTVTQENRIYEEKKIKQQQLDNLIDELSFEPNQEEKEEEEKENEI